MDVNRISNYLKTSRNSGLTAILIPYSIIYKISTPVALMAAAILWMIESCRIWILSLKTEVFFLVLLNVGEEYSNLVSHTLCSSNTHVQGFLDSTTSSRILKLHVQTIYELRHAPFLTGIRIGPMCYLLKLYISECTVQRYFSTEFPFSYWRTAFVNFTEIG